MSKELSFADEVWHRVVQILQEGIITGVDVVDILRQVRVEMNSDDETQLVLTQSYKTQVNENYEKMLKEAEHLKAESQEIPIVFGFVKDDATDNN